MQELFDAIAAGDAARVRELVGADATLAGCRDEDGVSARMLALYRGQREIAGVLLDAGPEPDVFEAAGFGADVTDEARGELKVQPLHSAAAASQNEICALLLDRGADPNARQGAGGRPIDAARQNGNGALVELLRSRGADE